MGARNGNDWSIFGFSGDPVPGDPSQIANVSHMITAREIAAHEVGVGVKSLYTDPAVGSWLGSSGDAFRKTLEPLPQLLQQLVDAYYVAASAVATYSHALSEAQTTADNAYRQRTAVLNEATAKNGGQRPPLSPDPDWGGWLNAPQGVGAAVWYDQQAAIVNTAVPNRDSAARACLKALHDAEAALHGVLATLGAPEFNDFNAQFVKNGGTLADLSRPGAPSELLGGALYSAQLNDLNAALAGDSDISPDILRTELDQLTSAYQDDHDFWQQLAPSLGNIPDWLKQHSGPNGTGGDSVLIGKLGSRLAVAASDGSVYASDFGTLSTTALIGLSRIIAAPSDGKAYKQPHGADFLASWTRIYINKDSSLGTEDRPAFGQALTAVLTTAAQNGDASRIMLSGPDGLDLATKLIQGSATVTYYTGRNSGHKVVDSLYANVDPNAVASFLDAADKSVDIAPDGARGNSIESQQRITAAYNIVSAAAQFQHWQEPFTYPTLAHTNSLPNAVSDSLYNYAKNFTYDLAMSTAEDNHNVGVFTKDNIPNGQPTFLVSTDQVTDFLNTALQDPNSAGTYQGYAIGQYTDAVKVAILGGPTHDHTDPYAQLIGKVQGIIDGGNLTDAQRKDAAASARLAMFNGLTGGLGNSPSGLTLGWVQASDGLMTPNAASIPWFDTTHAAQQEAANHETDQLQNNKGMVAVIQGAVNSGRLTAGMMGPGVLDPTGKVLNNGNLTEWYGGGGENTVLGPDGAKKSLLDYVNQLKQAIGEK